MSLDIANFIGNPSQSYISAGKTLTDITDTLDYTSTLAFKIDKFLNQLESEKQAKAIALKSLLDREMINSFNAQYNVDTFNSNEAYRRDTLNERTREFDTTSNMKQQQLDMQKQYNQHMMDMNNKKYELSKEKLKIMKDNYDFKKSRLAKQDKMMEQQLYQKNKEEQQKAIQDEQKSKIRQAYAQTMNMYQQKLANAKNEAEKKQILNDMAMLNREYRANGGRINLLYGANSALGSVGSNKTSSSPTFDFSSPNNLYNSATKMLGSRNGLSKVKSAISQLRANGKENEADIIEKAYINYKNIGKDINKNVTELTNDTFNNIKDKDSVNNILNNQGYVGELFSDLPYVKDLFNIKNIDKYKNKVRNIYRKDIKNGQTINGVPASKYLIDNFFNNPDAGFSRNVVAGAGMDRDIFKSIYKKVYGKKAPSNLGDFVGSYGSRAKDKKEIFEKIASDKNYPYAQIAKESAKKLISYMASGEDIKQTPIVINVGGKKKQIMLSPEEIKGFANIYTMYNLVK